MQDVLGLPVMLLLVPALEVRCEGRPFTMFTYFRIHVFITTFALRPSWHHRLPILRRAAVFGASQFRAHSGRTTSHVPLIRFKPESTPPLPFPALRPTFKFLAKRGHGLQADSAKRSSVDACAAKHFLSDFTHSLPKAKISLLLGSCAHSNGAPSWHSRTHGDTASRSLRL